MADNFQVSTGNDKMANDASSTARSGINNFDPTATQSNFLKSYNGMLGSQQSQTGDYVKNYADTIAKNPSVTDLYNTANDKFNVPGLQTQATYLNNQVNQAVPQAYNLARGFDVSDAQVQNQANTNLRFLQPAANAATANANTASTLAGQYVQAGQAQNAQNLLPIQAQAGFLQNQQNNQSGAYTSANANELQGLIAKMNAGVTLSTAEIARANQLAALEEAYQQNQNTNATTLKNTQLGNQYQNIAPGNSLINTFTGSITNPSYLLAQ